MKYGVLVAILALSLGAGVASANATSYRAPAHNFYQNNWLSGR